MSNIKLIDDSDKRLLFLELKIDEFAMLLVNCYLPYMGTANQTDQSEYINLLYKIQSVVIDHNYYNVIIMGDFNCHPNTPYFGELRNFVSEQNYILSDVELLDISSQTFTYISDLNNSLRWLDHVVMSVDLHNSIKSLEVLDNFFISDHKPIQVVLEKSFNKNYFNNTKHVSQVLDWSSVSDVQKIKYKRNTESSLNFNIPDSILNLNETDYSVVENDINIFYDNIVKALYNSSEFLL